MSPESLAGTVALVSGASRGIGEAIAVELARAGADVAVTARSEDALAATVDRVEDAGRRGITVPGDLLEPETPAGVVKDTVNRLGGLDILVNNAGLPAPWQRAEALEPEQWDRLLQVNLKAPFFLALNAREHLEGGGVVLNVASVAGLEATERMLPYSVTKAGLIQLTRDLATEWASDAIRVNAIAPGWVETQMTQGLRQNETIRQDLEASIPLQRFGTPDEIAPLARFLASEEARYITGSVFVADGGESI